MRKLQRRSYLPKTLGFNFPEVKKINILGCPSGSRPVYPQSGAEAHAHSSPGDKHKGHICIIRGLPEWIYKFGTDEPSNLMWHEYAHIVSEDVELTIPFGHGQKWQEVMRQLGQNWYGSYYQTNSDFLDPRIKIDDLKNIVRKRYSL